MPAESVSHASEIPPVHPVIHQLVVGVVSLSVPLTGMSVEIHGAENVPPPGSPLVVAANHMSNIDPFLVAQAMLPHGHYVQFMAKKQLFDGPGGWFIKKGGCFPVNREGSDVAATRTAVRILAAGGTVGIFPQGQRGGEAMRGGVALIAAKGRAPILPVGISRRGRTWVLNFGKPFRASSIKATTEELTRIIDHLTLPI